MGQWEAEKRPNACTGVSYRMLTHRPKDQHNAERRYSTLVVSCPVVTMTMHDSHTSKFFSSLVQAIQKDCNPHTYKGRLCSSWMPAGIHDQPKKQVYGPFQYGRRSSQKDGHDDILSSTIPPSMLSVDSTTFRRPPGRQLPH